MSDQRLFHAHFRAANRITSLFLAFVICLCALFSFSITASASEDADRKVVRVGFFAYDGYHMMDEDGNKSGYGYEFLQMASRYMNVTFEYVGYDKSWAEMQAMLFHGEIDLVTFARKSDWRENLFDYSKPIGTSRGILTIRSDNTSIIPSDYQSYDGMRVGFLTNLSRNEAFMELAEKKEFTYESVYFDSVTELSDALQNGSIDAIVSNSLRKLGDEKIIEEFDTGYFYTIVKKGNEDLLNDLNYAIDQLNTTEGDWKNELYYQCYGSTNNQKLNFTEREKELIQQYASGDKKLVMACSTDRDPYSYEENGELKGILPDLCQIIMESAGIPYDTIIPESREQYSQWQQDEVMDFIIDARVSEQFIEEHDYSASVPYITMKLARVTRRDFDGNIQKVAVARYQGLANIENQFIGDAEVITCDSREEALQAVLYGKADATYTYVYSAQKFVNTDERALLTYTVLEEPSFSYQFLFTGKVSHELSGIISKCIYALPEGEVNRIISEYTSYKAENMTFLTFTRLHPDMAALLIFLLICILITIAVLITMLHSRKQLLVFETRKAEEMNQLAKKAQSASESKSRFLSNMSHDIRTPMNAIIGFTQLAMDDGTDTEKVQGYLSKIMISSKHLLSIVNEVLEMSRIESGRFQLHEKPCYIPDVIEEAAVIIQEQTLERQQSFTVDISDIQDLHVICDPLRIREILINLLGNSVKYTPEGGSILLRVLQLPEASEGYGQYEIHIQDTGNGMKPEFLKKMFQPFEREQNSTVSGIQGTGLGLSITKHFIDLMGGTIEVHSEEGQGTEVIVQLQHKLASPDSVSQPSSSSLPLSDRLKGRRILLAEDNELNREILTVTLENQGFLMDTAEDGADAIDRLCSSPAGFYDVILMDIQMPMMNGYEATRKIRKLSNPELSQIPIIAVSANAFEEDKAASLEAGMNAHIGKPIKNEELLQALGSLLL